jgi:aspartyl-tRNA(Asn)/glutamyl-tRNA(Gln) amidotransferase subunit A
MAAGAIGSDTGGSVRIPAALCGLAGFKPTQSRVPRTGALPLSWTLDTIGPLARSIECCALLDAVLAGETPAVPAPMAVSGLRLAVPREIVLDGLDETVAAAFARALDRLSRAGARITEFSMPALTRIATANGKGGFATAEALAWHKDLLESRGDQYDPRVAVRIRRGAGQSAVDYIDLLAARTSIMAEAAAQTRAFDALVLPTVPLVAPRFDELEKDADYARLNVMMLRNPSLFNFLDRPAVTLPCASDGLPVGLMLVGERHQDHRLLVMALGLEPVVA